MKKLILAAALVASVAACSKHAPTAPQASKAEIDAVYKKEGFISGNHLEVENIAAYDCGSRIVKMHWLRFKENDKPVFYLTLKEKNVADFEMGMQFGWNPKTGSWAQLGQDPRTRKWSPSESGPEFSLAEDPSRARFRHVKENTYNECIRIP